MIEIKDKKIAVLLTTIPERRKILGKVLSSLINQNVKPTKIYIAFNSYQENDIPEYIKKNNDIFVFKIFSNDEERKDLSKWFFLKDINDFDYVFSADDDIRYPNNYIKNQIHYIEKYQKSVCVHGSIFKRKEINDFFDDRNVLHFKKSLSNDTEVDLPGTGTFAYSPQLLKMNYSDFDIVGASDVCLMKILNNNNQKCICVQRDSNWLVPLHTNQKTTIYATSTNSDAFRKKLTNEVNKILNNDQSYSSSVNIFKNIVYINLDEETRKKDELVKSVEKIQKIVPKFGENLFRLPAIKTYNNEKNFFSEHFFSKELRKYGAIGCKYSHLLAVLHSIQMDYDTVCIFEDDVKLSNKFDTDLINEFINNLPLDWACVYLFTNPNENTVVTKENDFYYKIKGTLGATAYILNLRNKRFISEYFHLHYTPKFNQFDRNDGVLRQLQDNFSFYLPKKMYGWVSGNDSKTGMYKIYPEYLSTKNVFLNNMKKHLKEIEINLTDFFTEKEIKE